MRYNEHSPVPHPSVVSAASAQDIMDDLFGDIAPPVPASAETPEAAPQPLDEAGAFAELVVGAWIEQLNALAADPVRQRYFGLEAEDFGQLVHEIIQGEHSRVFRNLELITEIRSELKTFQKG